MKKQISFILLFLACSNVLALDAPTQNTVFPAATHLNSTASQAVIKLVNDKHYDEAVKILLGVIKEHPKSAVAHYQLGQVYLRQFNYIAALNELEICKKLDSNLLFANNQETYYQAVKKATDMIAAGKLTEKLADKPVEKHDEKPLNQLQHVPVVPKIESVTAQKDTKIEESNNLVNKFLNDKDSIKILLSVLIGLLFILVLLVIFLILRGKKTQQPKMQTTSVVPVAVQQDELVDQESKIQKIQHVVQPVIEKAIDYQRHSTQQAKNTVVQTTQVNTQQSQKPSNGFQQGVIGGLIVGGAVGSTLANQDISEIPFDSGNDSCVQETTQDKNEFLSGLSETVESAISSVSFSSQSPSSDEISFDSGSFDSSTSSNSFDSNVQY